MRYSPGLLERRYGLRYGDAFQADANLVLTLGENDIPSWFRKNFQLVLIQSVWVSFDRQYDVDSYGRLIVPVGFLKWQGKRIEIVEMRLEVKVGRRRWQDISRSIKDKELLRSRKNISYHFYSNEAKEPIARVWMNASEKKVLKIEFKPRERENPVQNLANVKPDIYVSPNPAIASVRFEFYNLPPGTYRLSIFNIIGQEEWSKMYTINGNYAEQVDISQLKKGAYLYSLKDERGRTLSTKRLMVIRP
ncbi:MAG: T9SS type A sorting domain-containing protein [Haliscomenobacter sp.]|nr:T9SS type A sorting domain-containing protein [Haliscomenobacter sp.]MBK9488376.1 T9SS type A sorting domain-containing protein [Haliscomenobacter sp.]